MPPLPRRPFDETLRAQVGSHLAGFERRPAVEPGLRPAAVTIVLTPDEQGEACFLITRRPASMRRHARQWALPGGRLDPGEDEIQAALRETHEEIGLRLRAEDVLGLLDDFPTRSGFRMTPVVAWAEPGQILAPNPEEVEQLHAIPLVELEKPGSPVLRPIPESDRPVLSLPLLDTLIHAPTAAILYQLREVALAGRSTRVSHYEQPVFAWR
ncbi:MAG TPA: CoA pyrophosphatase [Myxococcota bacterium]|nr:CoA pyrophosphatase [Myxococcota bacterium]